MIFGVLVFNLKEFPHHSEGTYQHRNEVQTSTGNHCRNHVPVSELTKTGDFSVGFLIFSIIKNFHLEERTEASNPPITTVTCDVPLSINITKIEIIYY